MVQLRLGHTVLDCPDPLGVARFWSRLLRQPLRADVEGERYVVAPAAGGPGLAFERVGPVRGQGGAPRTSAPAAVALPGWLSRSGDRQRPTEGVVLDLVVRDRERALDDVLRWGGLPVDAPWAGQAEVFSDPAGHHLRLVQGDPDGSLPGDAAPELATADPGPTPAVSRYVAIGDSHTEGLADPDGAGGWRGWADRLAARIATTQDRPLAYANLAVSGYRLAEIRRTQLDRALSMQPDLVSVTGGMNDVLNLRPSFAAIEEELAEIFAATTGHGARVLTLTTPDISRANPLATAIRDRILTLNEIIRRTALHHDVAVLDFENVPSASDPRLWAEDRLHVNELAHLRIAAAMAWLLRLPGSDRDWAHELDDQPGRAPAGATDVPPAGLGSHLHWARRHFGPWVVAGIRGAGYRQGTECKRPELIPVRVEEGDPDPPDRGVAAR